MMWNHKFLLRLDFRLISVIFILMTISLFLISSMTFDPSDDKFLTPLVKSQLEWFFLGWFCFFFFAGFDYRKFREWTWIFYLLIVLLLIGLYFTAPIHSVHRWYRIPFLRVDFQPSEYAKLIVVVTLGWFLEKRGQNSSSLSSSLLICAIVGIPFILILREPDLGTALVLYPIALVMCYFGGANKLLLRFMSLFGLVVLTVVLLFFTGILSHKEMKPFFTSFLKEYQYERLNPNTYHQRAAQNSIAAGGLLGSGWKKSEFASQKWLPAAHTDSVFAAFGEEFGFVGIIFLLFLFYALIYFNFQVVAMANDNFGRLLSSGIAVYLSMHIIVNMMMMCGFLPITGVPLVLVTYGGSSAITTMIALGISQSIYARRFMF